MSRSNAREFRVGLIVVLGIVGLGCLLVLASGGPGFLTNRRIIDVVFRDGQGVRVGCPVRVAGIDAGRVQAVELVELDGELRARVRISVTAEVADRLRQDVRIAVASGLTGQSIVNVVNAGRSDVALVAGQVVHGVESSFFDPILEQVGLGPAERSHISHMIGEVRQTMDEAAPRIRGVVAALEGTAGDVRETVAAVRPRVEATAARIESLAVAIDEAEVAGSIQKVQSLVTQLETLVTENRPALAQVLTNLDAVLAEVRDLARANRPQIDALIAGMNTTRAKLDTVLANAEVLTDQGAGLLTQNRANLDRTVANVRDASGYGLKLVQKLYGNPFYLSPFYKPRPEDIRAQEMYDAATTFLLGAKEFSDALKSLEALRGRATTNREQDAYNRLFNRAWELVGQMNLTQKQLADGLRENTQPRR